MAKGRKLTISRSERFLGSYSNSHDQLSYGNDSSELREEDVWSMIENSHNGDDLGNISARARRRTAQDGGAPNSFQDSGRTTAGSRNNSAGQHESAIGRGHHVASSAPMNVPDWSKILRVDSVESLPELGDDSEMIPPHEYLAREYARSRNSAATSVFEGVGRTLKGRDLRRVRDAVWSQTGFDG